MNGEVAVQARPVKNKVPLLIYGRFIIDRAGMAGSDMATLAQQIGAFGDQHFVMQGSMSVVAIQAIFPNGRVLP